MTARRLEQAMKLSVNGTTTEVTAVSDEPVVDVLRDRLGLTGTKAACGTGACGACTILLDGAPAVGCLTVCAVVQDREITTVEGLGGDHPVQRAFAAHDALQCGYCTPGFVVEAAAFVDRWRAEHADSQVPDRAAIARAMAGHLCRCGAYQAIFAAIAAACAGKHDAELRTAPARVEALEKITGRARYTADVRLDGQLEGVIIRSVHAHARVTAVAAGDLPLVELLPPDRRVRYVGQPIAAVVAASRAEALAAVRAVQIGYEVLEAVVGTEEALRPGAPVVHPTKEIRKGAPRSNEGPPSPAKWNGNLRGPSSMSWRAGTAMKRIKAAAEAGDERLVSATYTTQVQAHTSMEPHGCVARWDENGDLHLHLSTQAVTRVAEQAARRWKLKPEQVHIVAEHVGGGFGSKVNVSSDVVAAVELARLTNAPVRVVLSRAEELVDGGSRPGTRSELNLLAGPDGDLVALSLDVHGDGGVSIASNAASHARLLYGNAPRRIRDFDVLTNRPPGAPFRGPGLPPMLWALEQAVDEAAHRLGSDPLELRRRWDGNPKRHALYDLAAKLPLWTGRPATGAGTGRIRRGVGLAIANYMYFLDPGTQVELTVQDGIVVARIATQDIGTGSRSVIASVVGAELGLKPDQVRVELGRSGTVYGPSSASSCVTPSIGPAARDAARRLRAELGTRTLTEAGGLRVVGRRRRDRRGYVTPFPLQHFSIGRGFSGAVYVTEVEVDTRLGSVRATRVWCGIAAGHIYSERLARSQCEGGVIQGVGYALLEERHTDPATGAVLTAGLDDYRIPGIADTPEIDVHFHQDGWDHVTGKGVGLGELSTMGMAASVGNAVHNATGWRPHEAPIRPDRLLDGLAHNAKGLER